MYPAFTEYVELSLWIDKLRKIHPAFSKYLTQLESFQLGLKLSQSMFINLYKTQSFVALTFFQPTNQDNYIIFALLVIRNRIPPIIYQALTDQHVKREVCSEYKLKNDLFCAAFSHADGHPAICRIWAYCAPLDGYCECFCGNLEILDRFERLSDG